MTPRSLQLPLLIALLASPAFLFAQETSANEDERIEQLVRSEASEWYTPKNSVSVGFRTLTSGTNVRFGNLGSIGFSSSVVASAKPVKRVYDNGFVDVDAARAAELDANGIQVTTPGGRYQTYTTTPVYTYDTAGNVISTEYVKTVATDSLSYTPGLTRVWGYSTPEQALENPGYIGMSSYSATSDGESRTHKEGLNSGVELQLSHALRKIGKKSELSVIGGIGLNGINNKTSGTVKSTLLTFTDYYSLHGQPAPTTSLDTPYSAPSYPTYATETTAPISAVADQSTLIPTTGAAIVNGNWQVRGAYFMVRVGPSIRTQITEHFALSASLGLAGAYVGTSYTAVESMAVPIIGTKISDPISSSETTKLLGGYFADVNMEWTATDSMGLYTGFTAQKFGSYTQTLGDRTAHVDLGSSMGIRGGMNIKF